VARIPFRRRPKNETVLRPIHPNVGIEAAYRRKLQRLIEEMGRSVHRWVRAAYRADPPRMAQDAVPAAELNDVVSQMAKRWQKRFDEAAPELADWFARSNRKRSDAALKAILKKGGFTVEFKLTPTIRDVARASVEANVQLIRSIPEQYLGQVQGVVMRSVQTGRDLGQLTKDLQKQFGVTYKRAAFIALDQNAKATSAIQKARQLELDPDPQGVWLHSHGGREPRPTHLANHGKRFSIAKGWHDPDPRVRRRIMPGELSRCRCVWRMVVKGFS
jgi:uncharacterized protein with gpF-like domain